MPRDTSKLRAFQLADRLALHVQRSTTTLPTTERHELGRQIRRAALSVPTNLVEGGQRDTSREYRRFVSIALGSAAEVRYLLTVAQRLQLMEAEVSDLISEYDALCRALHNLHKSLGGLR